MKKLIAAGLLLFLPAPGVHATTIDEVMAVSNILDAHIHPAGKAVAWSVAAIDSSGRAWNADVWITLLDGMDARRVTSEAAWDDLPRWSPDGSMRLAFVSDSTGANQIFLVDLPDGRPRMLTEAANGVTAYAWSPDGRHIAYISPGGESEAMRARREAGTDVHIEDEPAPRARIHVVEIESGTDRELPELAGDVTTLDWSPDGSRIAITLQKLPGVVGLFFGTDVFVVDVTSGEATSIVEREGMDVNPRWSPDGRWLAFLSHDGVKDWIGCCYVCVVPADGGKPRNISREFEDRDYDAEYHWSADSKRIYLVAPRGVTRHLYEIDPGTLKSKRVTDGTAVFGKFSFTRDGKRCAFMRTDSDHPGEVFTASMRSFRPEPVTRLNETIGQSKLARSEIVRWKSFDGLEIEGILFLPAAHEPGTRLPLVVNVHGGPSAPMLASFAPQNGPVTWPQAELIPHVLTELGYAVFLPNFRGSGGYGRAFLRANIGDWGGGDYRDVMTGVDMLVERGIVDPERLAIAGWSYGGTLASFIITQTPRFKAAMVGAGVTDQLSQYGTTDIPPLVETYMGGAPWQVPETYRRCSSVTHAHQVTTPTLLCYGENDARVPPSQGREFYRILRRNEVPAELVIYPRSGHFVFEPALAADLHRRTVAWVQRWLEVP